MMSTEIHGSHLFNNQFNKFAVKLLNGLKQSVLYHANTYEDANLRHGVQMFSQISGIPDLMRKF